MQTNCWLQIQKILCACSEWSRETSAWRLEVTKQKNAYFITLWILITNGWSKNALSKVALDYTWWCLMMLDDTWWCLMMLDNTWWCLMTLDALDDAILRLMVLECLIYLNNNQDNAPCIIFFSAIVRQAFTTDDNGLLRVSRFLYSNSHLWIML